MHRRATRRPLELRRRVPARKSLLSQHTYSAESEQPAAQRAKHAPNGVISSREAALPWTNHAHEMDIIVNFDKKLSRISRAAMAPDMSPSAHN